MTGNEFQRCHSVAYVISGAENRSRTVAQAGGESESTENFSVPKKI